MKLWVGLGNPGAKYAGNRHNIGFMAVDRIAADHGFSPWRARFQGEVAEGILAGGKVMLLKPATYMNLSGQSVAEAARFHKLALSDVTVFHDEIDLAPGRIRVKSGGGHAGHNGLRSIHAHLGEGYHRVRLGVGHPGHKDAVAHHVLHDFARADRDWLDALLQGISEGAPALGAGESARFLNAVSLRMVPHTAPHSDPQTKPHTAPPRPARTDPPAAVAAPSPPTAEPLAQPTAQPTAEPVAETRSALQRLADRFRSSS